MTPRERVLAVLTLKEPDQVPFVDWVDDNFKRNMMGVQEVDEAEFAHKTGLDGIYLWDYMTPFFCKGRGDYPDGPKVGVGDEGHFIGEGIISSDKDLHLLQLPDPKSPGFFDPAKKFMDRYGNTDLALFAHLRPLGMFNVIFSMPMVDFSRALYSNLNLINTMMDIFIEWNLVIIDELQKLGFDFIFANNDMAFKTGPLVSPQILREVFLPKMKQAASAIKVPWAYHSDGDLSIVMDDLLELGMAAVNPFEPPCMDLKTGKEKWGDKVCLWGNIDLVHTLPHGTVEEVEAEVKQRIQDAGQGGGYICGSANSITTNCKPENYLAIAKAIKKYGKYPLNI